MKSTLYEFNILDDENDTSCRPKRWFVSLLERVDKSKSYEYAPTAQQIFEP